MKSDTKKRGDKLTKKTSSKWLSLSMLIFLLLGTLSPSVLAVADTLDQEAPLESQASDVLQADTKESTMVTTTSETSGVKYTITKNVKALGETEATKETQEETKESKEKNSSKKKTITVLGTSDVHGNVWDWSYEDDKEADFGFAKIGTIVKEVEATTNNTLLVDAGDNLQGTLLTDDLFSTEAEFLKQNHPVITAMNTIGYDAMALGNHEFNFGLELIKKVEEEAKFPLLSANTYVKNTNENFVKATHIKQVDGLKVAVIGLTIPHVPKWDGEKVATLDFKPLNTEAKKQVEILNATEHPDVIVAAIHAGLDNEDPAAAARNVIKEVPEIDAFVLGHDHREFAEKIADNEGTLKPAAAVKDTGAGVVRIDLEVEKNEEDKWEVTESTPSIIHSKGKKGDEEVRKATKAAHEATQKHVSGIIGTASDNFLPEERIPGIPEAQLQPTAMISLINNVQMEVTDAQLGAAALFKTDSKLNKGPIKLSDVFNIYKYPNTLIGANMTGAQLKNYLEKQATYYQQYEPGDLTVAFNPNFRVYNYDMIAGAYYEIDISKPENERITTLTVNGVDVKPEDNFKIALNNYRFEGMASEGFVDPTPYYESDPKTLRGEMIRYIQEKVTIDPNKEREESFKLVGFDLNHPKREYVIEQIKKGTPGFEVEASKDGRTPNVRKFNINQLIKDGLVEDDEPSEDDFTFTIMHTNDMHGRLLHEKDKSIGMAKLKTFKDEKNPTLMLDGGDSLQGLAISNFSEGMDMAKAMSLLPYDAVAAGNHEFDFGYDRAMTYKELLPMVSANVTKNAVTSFAPYKIIDKENKKFAVIGLSTPETAYKTHPKNVEGVTFSDPIPVAKATINRLKESEKPDAFVFVTHLGIDKTTPEAWRGDTLAKSLSETFEKDKIIVIDGHSHSALHDGMQFGNVLLAQTGNYLNNVGMIQATYKGDTPNFDATLVSAKEFNDTVDNPEVKKIVDETAKKFEKEMSQIVLKNNPVFLEGDGAFGRTRETNLGNLIADSLYNYGQTGFKDGQTDLAVINGGGIRVSIEKGDVTKGDVLAVLPFGNTIAQIDVTGKQLKEMFEHSLRSDPQTDKEGAVILDEIGQPLLGRNGGFLQVSDSVKVSFDATRRGAKPEDKIAGDRVFSVKIKNRQSGKFEEIKETQTYKLATNDFLAAGGDGYTMLGGKREEGPSMDVIFTEFLQDIAKTPDSKVRAIASKKYQLEDYQEIFPYSRIIPSKKVEEPAGKNVVRIMHTNDMHGRMEYKEDKYSPSIGLGRVKTFKDNERPTLLVDAGDAMQGLPISNYSKGMDMVKAMNAVGYDAMTLGNHEFDFGLDTALAYKEKLNFPIVSANVYNKDGSRPFEPYVIVSKDVNGKKQNFALIGLTTPETSVKTHPNNVKNITFEKPAPVAIKTIEDIGDKADYFVFMTHLGFDGTTLKDETSTYLAESLAKAFPDKNIFIADGHSHSELSDGMKKNNVLIGQTGNHLNNVGMMTGDYSGDKAELTAVLHPFSELKELTPDASVEKIVKDAQDAFNKEMSEVVLKQNNILFNGERHNARTRETNLGNIIGDSLMAYGKKGFKEPSDFAVMNGGGIRQSIKPGSVTKGDIVGVMPFGNTISQIKVTGNEIYAMFEHSLRSIHAVDEAGNPVLGHNDLPELGENGGFLQVSDSIKVSFNPNLDGTKDDKVEQRVWNIQIKDQSGAFVDVPRDDKTTYNMVTNDFLVAGGYKMLTGKAGEQGPSMDVAFMDYLTGLSSKELENYHVELPYSRIIPAIEISKELERLVATIKENYNEENYTAHSWSILANSLKEASLVLEAKDTDKAESALTKLDEAKEQLVSIKELAGAVEKGDKVKESNYTAKTWKAFKAELEKAKELLDKAKNVDENIEQTAIIDILAALNKVEKGLEKVTSQGSGSTTTNGTSKPTKLLPKTGEAKSFMGIIGVVIVGGAGFAIYRKKKNDEDKAA